MSNSLSRCKLQHGWIKPFLSAIQNGYTEKNAANMSGVGTNAVHNLIEKDPEFGKRYDEAQKNARPRFGHGAW
jgi:hypothetical protein